MKLLSAPKPGLSGRDRRESERKALLPRQSC
jgi:hypothetical protein